MVAPCLGPVINSSEIPLSLLRGNLDLHEWIIDSNDEDIASRFQVLVVDVARDMCV